MRPSHRNLAGHDAHTRASRLRVALVINLVIVGVQVVVGVRSHSLGLLADAGHNLTDVVGLTLAFVAVLFTRRPATTHRSFGWHRGTILAAQANAAMILVLTVWIVVAGVKRLSDAPPVNGAPVLIVALLAFVANAIAAVMVREPHHHHQAEPARAPDAAATARRDLNLHAAMLHLVGDAAASLGVAVAGAVIVLTDGWYWLDPAVSIAIGLSIGWHAWRLLRSSNAVLLEGVPAGIDPLELRDSMLGVAGVDAVHDLHVWAIASNFVALSAHIVVRDQPTLAEAQAIAANVRQVLDRRYAITHSTLELEDIACTPDGEPCDFTEPLPRGSHA